MSTGSKEISKELIDSLCAEFESDPQQKLMQNILTKNELLALRVSRDRTQVYANPHQFLVQVTPRTKVSDQKSSGRCWEFAAHNVIRRAMIEKFNLPLDWEFSQSFFFFWDKFERMNYNMLRIIDTVLEPCDSRIVQHLLSDPTCDGGQWDMFCNIVAKHGMVPKAVYPESVHSSKTRALNTVLKRLFRKTAMRIRTVCYARADDDDMDTCHSLLDTFRKDVYCILCKTLGTPPNSFV